MARIAGVDLPRDKRIEVGLTYIYGIGQTTADRILKDSGVNPDTRCKDLTDEEVKKFLLTSRDFRRSVAIAEFVIERDFPFADRRPRRMHVPVRVPARPSQIRRSN